MVLPEGTRTDSPKRKATRRGLFIAAAGALAVGVIALGALTAPDEPAAAEAGSTTTTEALQAPVDVENFSVSQIATGEPLQFERAARFDTGFATALVEHQGWTYLFLSPENPWTEETVTGLQVWRSEDGDTWEPLGEVLESADSIRVVSSTPQGLIAVADGRDDSTFTIWRSSDAIQWEPTVVSNTEGDEVSRFQATSAGGTDRLIVVSGETYADTQQILQSRLDEAGLDIDITNLGWGIEQQGDEVEFTFYGPLGFISRKVTASELGMTEDETDLIYNGTPNQSATVWVSVDGGDFQRQTIERASWIERFVAAPDGSLLAFGWGNMGGGVWKTWDGTIWEDVGSGARTVDARVWRGHLVGPARNVPGLSILDSFDGSKWSELGDLSRLFPTGIEWSAGSFAAGDGGMAMTVDGYNPRAAVEPRREPVEITHDGFTLRVDLNVGLVELETPSGESNSWSTYANTLPEGVVVDVAAGVVRFDVAGETAEFTIDELSEAESDYWNYDAGYAPGHFAMLFSRDGETWSIQDMEESLGEGNWVGNLVMTGDRVVVLLNHPFNYSNANDSGGFEIWSAPLP